MCETNDGFKISEVDMQLRRYGDILGTQQSGMVDFKRLDLVNDGNIIKAKRNRRTFAKIDGNLQLPEHQSLRNYYVKQYKGKNKWGKIS